MSVEIKNLTQQILVLGEEIKSIREKYENCQQTLSSYEQIIGDSNSNFLRADMARMELEQIFSAYTDAMWVVSEDGLVVRANHAMCEMLGKPEDEVLGKKCSELLKYTLCGSKRCPLENIEFPSSEEFDIQIEGDKGNSHYLLTTASLITLTGDPGILAQFKDISIRKQAEETLKNANLTLAAMASTDGLTQIPNRRNFDEALVREWKRLCRTPKPLSLLLGDIDFFKRYNDHYGHQAGDDCLRQVAKALEGILLRPADQAARYGGEEFVLLLPETDFDGAHQVGQRALAAIAALTIPHEKSDVSASVSISLGTATLIPTTEKDPNDLIRLADVALYQAKEAGRNQIFPRQP